MSASASAAVLAVAALEGAWLVGAEALRRATRPAPLEPAPVPNAVGDEPPALVNLLVGNGEVTTEAVPATVIDLAGRDLLTIVPVDDTHDVIELRPRSELPKKLRPYERLVLDHLRKRSRRGIVLARATASHPAAVDPGWRDRFQRAVAADARRRRLARPRYPLAALAGLGTLLVVLLLVLAGTLRATADGAGARPAWWAIAAAVVAALACVRSMLSFDPRAVRLTAAGREAAERWIGLRSVYVDGAGYEHAPPAAAAAYYPHFGYAAAMGAAGTAVDRLPLGAEDDRHAWSPAGGRWRPVTVRYPAQRWWGTSPTRAIAKGAAWSALLVAPVVATVVLGSDLYGWAFDLVEPLADPGDPASPLGEGGRRWAAFGISLLAGALLTVLSALAIGRGVVPLGLGLADLPARRPARGMVVRTRRLARARGEGVEVDAYTAVDDGTAPVITAWRVRPALVDVLQQGNEVEAQVTPRLRYVRTARVVAAWQPVVEPAPVEEPGVDLLFGAEPDWSESGWQPPTGPG